MSTSRRPDDGLPAEDLLDTGRRLPRWLRTAAAGLVVVVLGYLAVRQLQSNAGKHQTAAAPSTSLSAGTTAPPARPPGGGTRTSPQPECGPRLGPVRVRAATGGRPTHLRLLVGGSALQRVDFDTGYSVRLHGLPQIGPDEWFGSLARAAGTSYAMTSTLPCEVVNTAVFAVRGNRTSLASPGSSFVVVSDESRAWAVRDPPHVLSPLAGGHQVRMPAGFVPVAATRGQIVGNLVSAMDPEEIIAVDATTGHQHGTAGASGAVIAARAGRVYWAGGCGTGTPPCVLDSATVGGGSPRVYPLAVKPVTTPGLVSPDGRKLALVVTSAATRSQPHRDLAARLAVLDVRTGRLHIVPGISVSAADQPSFTFARRGWLVIGYEHGGVEGLAAWRPGLRRPVRSPFRGAGPAAPPIAVVSG